MNYNKKHSVDKNLSPDSSNIRFLGKDMTEEEYQEACRNLEGFFEILIKWQKKEGANEKETQS